MSKWLTIKSHLYVNIKTNSDHSFLQNNTKDSESLLLLHFKVTICESDPRQCNLFYAPISKQNSSSDKMFFLTRYFQKQVFNQSIVISYCDR